MTRLWSRRLRGHDSDYAGEAILDHFDTRKDYEKTTARSRSTTPGNGRVLRLSLPGVLHEGAAMACVEDGLRDHQATRRSTRFSLSPAMVALEPGDVVTLDGGPDGVFLVSRIEDGAVRAVEARGFVPSGGSGAPVAIDTSRAPRQVSDGFDPVVHLMDLPQYEAGDAAGFARAAVFSRPWHAVTLSSSAGLDGYRARARLDQPAQTGLLAQVLMPGVSGRFDPAGIVVLDLHFGGLSSASTIAVLNGQNRIAVRASNGTWEIIGYRMAEEISAGRWQLSGLLRGLHGTEDAMMSGAVAGAAAVVLNSAVRPLGLATGEAGQAMNWIVETSGQAAAPVGPFAFVGGLRAETPIAPVHLKARRQEAGDIRFSWVRRARRDADHWLDGDIALDEPEERYRIDILDGSAIKRSIEVLQPDCLYPVSDELADFGAVQTAVSIRVRQVGAKVAHGLGASALLSIG